MNIKMQLHRAERKQAKLRIGLFGPSGSGKTMSALKIARGITEWDKIAVIDTENHSADLYSHLGPYNVLTLEAPFAPEKYIEAITACEDAGMDVIIIDSITHEWAGQGGVLEIADQLGKDSKNSFTVWAKLTPRHNKFIDKIISSPVHVICCGRSKQDYVMNQIEKNGRTVNVPEKIGLKAITREGFDYEMTVSFDLAISHLANSTKDRTSIFQDKPEAVITELTGQKLKEWNEGGKIDINAQKMEIMRQLKRLGWQTTDATVIMAEVKNITGLDLVEANYGQIISLLAMTDPASLKKKDPPAPTPAEEPKKEVPAGQPALDLDPKKEEPPKEELPPEDNTPVSAVKIGMLKAIAKEKHKINTETELINFIDFIYDVKVEKLKYLTAVQADRLIKEILDGEKKKGDKI